ncbi:MAG: hypothetical protein CME55_00585 [Halieaceae bacterium]|nr:hypothetical protein [Halieaceae bacterium]
MQISANLVPDFLQVSNSQKLSAKIYHREMVILEHAGRRSTQFFSNIPSSRTLHLLLTGFLLVRVGVSNFSQHFAEELESFW